MRVLYMRNHKAWQPEGRVANHSADVRTVRMWGKVNAAAQFTVLISIQPVTLNLQNDISIFRV